MTNGFTSTIVASNSLNALAHPMIVSEALLINSGSIPNPNASSLA